MFGRQLWAILFFLVSVRYIYARYHLVFHCCAFPLLSLVQCDLLRNHVHCTVYTAPPMDGSYVFSTVRASRIRVAHLLGKKLFIVVFSPFLTLLLHSVQSAHKRESINGIDNSIEYVCCFFFTFISLLPFFFFSLLLVATMTDQSSGLIILLFLTLFYFNKLHHISSKCCTCRTIISFPLNQIVHTRSDARR